MINIKKQKCYIYAKDVVSGKKIAPRYVIMQCQEFLDIADNKNEKYEINLNLLNKINKILKLLKMPKGLYAGKSIFDCLAGFQHLLITASLCIVHSEDTKKRRYESVLLEIARKNSKTFSTALIVLLLFFLEPQFSYFYSLAPTGALSREIKKALEEIISANVDVLTLEGPDKIFKLRRDDIFFYPKKSTYIPLNYSNSTLDGRLPNVAIVDEASALPSSYGIEALKSGMLTIKNKLIFIISTKYDVQDNPFDDEIAYSKSVLDKKIDDEKVFSLLFEPDNTKDWQTSDISLAQANPLAQEVPDIWEDLLDKRQRAIEMTSARANFLLKHMNIYYSDIGIEGYIPIEDVKKCKTDEIDWNGRKVFLGLDLSMSGDNTAVSMVALDDDEETVLAESFCFVPADKINEKSRTEHLDYKRYIEQEGKCFACGDLVINYGYIERFIMQIEEKFGVEVIQIGYDPWNCRSSAEKLQNEGFEMVEIKQHSSCLHSPTKFLYEKIMKQHFKYANNTLLEINFSNCRCTFDTNMNRFITKKKSLGKIDMVVSMINAIYLLEQDIIYNDDFVAVSF